MDLRRLRHGEWIAATGGVVLFVSLFLDWYSSAGGAKRGGGTATGWESFEVADVVFTVAALMGVGLAVAAATQRAPAVAQAISALTVPVGIAAVVLVVIYAISLPHGADDREIGLWLGLAGALGVLVGAYRSMGDQSFPATARPRVEVTPLPAPKASPDE
jgi:hypothetical protein